MSVLMVALIGFAARAQTGYPKAKDLYVNDFAKILRVEDEGSIRTALAKFRDDTGAHVVVGSIQSIHDYGTGDQTIESFATSLFNTWGIGDSRRNDGVLILVAVKDRKVRIELGSGYGKSYNERMQGVLNQQMLPRFKMKNYSRGVLEGTSSVVRILSQPAPTVISQPTPAPTVEYYSASTSDSDSDSGGGALPFVIMGGLIVAVFGLIWYVRSRKRRCPDCQVAMEILDTGKEDQYLDDGQRLEKSLGSVNYWLWQCPRCGHHDLQAQSRWLSPFAGCHSCGYRAMKVSEMITIHPTQFTPGEKLIDKICHYCGFHRSETIILPTLPQDTRPEYNRSQYNAFESNTSYTSGFDSGGSSFDSGSSSSGSFDGGSSSGDGASGSW
jgi:uncharacterized protein